MNHSNPEVDFWLDVQRELESVHGQATEKAREGIDGYRQRLARHDALDAVDHSEPREIANAIAGGRFRLGPSRS